MAQLIRINRWDEKNPNMEMEYSTSRDNIESLYKEIVVLINEETTSLMYNERLHGISPNGKHWFKFRTPRKLLYTIKSNSYGDKVGRIYYKEGRTFYNVSMSLEYHMAKIFSEQKNSSGVDVFSLAIRDVASRNGVDIPLSSSIHSPTFMYPVLAHLKFSPYATKMDTSITRHASTSDLGLFVQRAFGKTRYRKDLVKAVANLTSMPVFMLGYSFRGLVPIDWIIDFYRAFEKRAPQMYSSDIFMGDNHKSLRFLTKKQAHKLFKLLLDNKTLHNTGRLTIADTFTSIADIGNTKHLEHLDQINFTNMKEAHDKFATFARVAKELSRNAKFAEPLKLTDLAGKLVEQDNPEDEIRLRPAHYPKDLIEWGGQMGHCIASYTSQAINGVGTYVGIYQNNKLIGNLEYSRNRLTQVFGEYNAQLPKDVLIPVLEKLLNTGLVAFENTRQCYGLNKINGTPEYQALKEKYPAKKGATLKMKVPEDGQEGAAINLDWQGVGWMDANAIQDNWAPNPQYLAPPVQQPFGYNV